MQKKWIPFAAVIAVFVAFTFFIPGENLSLTLTGDVLTVSHVTRTALKRTEDARADIDLTQVKRIVLTEEMDLGQMRDGNVSRRCSCGTWTNAEYENYRLFVYNNVRMYIVLELHNCQPVVVNLESRAMTESFYTALSELVNR